MSQNFGSEYQENIFQNKYIEACLNFKKPNYVLEFKNKEATEERQKIILLEKRQFCQKLNAFDKKQNVKKQLYIFKDCDQKIIDIYFQFFQYFPRKDLIYSIEDSYYLDKKQTFYVFEILSPEMIDERIYSSQFIENNFEIINSISQKLQNLFCEYLIKFDEEEIQIYFRSNKNQQRLNIFDLKLRLENNVSEQYKQMIFLKMAIIKLFNLQITEMICLIMTTNLIAKVAIEEGEDKDDIFSQDQFSEEIKPIEKEKQNVSPSHIKGEEQSSNNLDDLFDDDNQFDCKSSNCNQDEISEQNFQDNQIQKHQEEGEGKDDIFSQDQFSEEIKPIEKEKQNASPSHIKGEEQLLRKLINLNENVFIILKKDNLIAKIKEFYSDKLNYHQEEIFILLQQLPKYDNFEHLILIIFSQNAQKL
ncbi:hypothetical protein ABPG72_008238 [Tetrahymena utriculariae]